MTRPPEPSDPYFEGGPTRSRVAPGDTGRELLHEVTNLATAVALLQATVVRWERQRSKMIVTVVAAGLLLCVAVGYFRYQSLQQIRGRVDVGRVACLQDNARGAVEIEILEASAAASKGDPKVDAFFQPRIERFKALQKDCASLYPSPGRPGWPSYWSFQ